MTTECLAHKNHLLLEFNDFAPQIQPARPKDCGSIIPAPSALVKPHTELHLDRFAGEATTPRPRSIGFRTAIADFHKKSATLLRILP